MDEEDLLDDEEELLDEENGDRVQGACAAGADEDVVVSDGEDEVTCQPEAVPGTPPCVPRLEEGSPMDHSSPVQRQRIDPELPSVSFPAAAVRRIARSAAPGVRFSQDALAGLHRVAQAFVLYATERSLQSIMNEVEAAKKAGKKGVAKPIPKKTLGIDHVMHFLASDMPAISTKLSTLFPDLVPHEYKPEAVRLLEALWYQQNAGKAELIGSPTGAKAAGEAGGEDAQLETGGGFMVQLAADAKRKASEAADAPPAKKRATDVAEPVAAAPAAPRTLMFGRKAEAMPAAPVDDNQEDPIVDTQPASGLLAAPAGA